MTKWFTVIFNDILPFVSVFPCETISVVDNYTLKMNDKEYQFERIINVIYDENNKEIYRRKSE